jgi:hypothetical protein
MAVNLPTIEELEVQILNNYATEFGVNVDDLGDSFKVDAKVEAALTYQFYLTLGHVELNVFPDLSDDETLIRFGQGLLNRTPAPARAGIYEIAVVGTIGATISAGTTFIGDDTSSAPGYLYVVDSNFTLSSETDYLEVRALTPGLEFKLEIGNTITSTQPLLNVADQATVTYITTNPTDAESIDSYREDVLTAYRLEPQGGSPSDYRLWALDVPEVRTVYPYVKQNNVGSLDIYVEATLENSETIVGVPSQQILDSVYKKPSGGDPESGAIVYNESEQTGRRPLGIFNIDTLPVDPVSVDLEFTDLTNIASGNSIRAAVEEYLYTVRPFIAGAESLLDKNDILTVGQLISIVVSVLEDVGGTFSDLAMRVDNNIVSTYTFNFGNYPYLRNLTNNGVPI